MSVFTLSHVLTDSPQEITEHLLGLFTRINRVNFGLIYPKVMLLPLEGDAHRTLTGFLMKGHAGMTAGVCLSQLAGQNGFQRIDLGPSKYSPGCLSISAA